MASADQYLSKKTLENIQTSAPTADHYLTAPTQQKVAVTQNADTYLSPKTKSNLATGGNQPGIDTALATRLTERGATPRQISTLAPKPTPSTFSLDNASEASDKLLGGIGKVMSLPFEAITGAEKGIGALSTLAAQKITGSGNKTLQEAYSEAPTAGSMIAQTLENIQGATRGNKTTLDYFVPEFIGQLADAGVAAVVLGPIGERIATKTGSVKVSPEQMADVMTGRVPQGEPLPAETVDLIKKELLKPETAKEVIKQAAKQGVEFKTASPAGPLRQMAGEFVGGKANEGKTETLVGGKPITAVKAPTMAERLAVEMQTKGPQVTEVKPTMADQVAQKVREEKNNAVSEFEKMGEELFHGTSKSFDKFSPKDAVDRYGRPLKWEGTYFTPDQNIARDFAENGAFRQVNVDHFYGEEIPGENYKELYDSLQKQINKGKKVGYIDSDPRSKTEGQFIQVQKSSDILKDELESGDVRIYTKEPRIIKERIYGKTLDLTNLKSIPEDYFNTPDIYDPRKKMSGIYFEHEGNQPLIEYARSHGYGKIIVPDAFESGYKSVIAIPEYIANGRTAEQVYNDIQKKTGAQLTMAEQLKAVVEAPTAPAKAALDINKTLVEQGVKALPESELAQYSTYKVAEQTNRIAELMASDLESAKQMALGNVEIPDNVKPQILYNAIKAQAKATGDTQLIMDLAKSPIATQRSEAASTLGSSAINNGNTDPVEIIHELNKKMKKATEKKIAKATTEEKSKFRQAVKKARAPKQEWSEFVDSIIC